MARRGLLLVAAGYFIVLAFSLGHDHIVLLLRR